MGVKNIVSKDLAKLGNISVETLFYLIVSSVPKLGNMFPKQRLHLGSKKCFWLASKTFSCFQGAKVASWTNVPSVARQGNFCCHNNVSLTVSPSYSWVSLVCCLQAWVVHRKTIVKFAKRTKTILKLTGLDKRRNALTETAEMRTILRKTIPPML